MPKTTNVGDLDVPRNRARPRVRRREPRQIEKTAYLDCRNGSTAPPFSYFEGRSYREDELAFLKAVDRWRRRHHCAPTLADALAIAFEAGYRKLRN